MTTAQTNPAREWLTYCHANGVRVWIEYGQTNIEGYVLSATRHTADVQDATTGHIQTIAYAAITNSGSDEA